jgi:hypothetical protein
MFTAFGLGVALKKKERMWINEIDTVDPTLVPYVNEPDLVNYNLFVVVSLTVCLTKDIIRLRLSLINAGYHLNQRDHLRLTFQYSSV